MFLQKWKPFPQLENSEWTSVKELAPEPNTEIPPFPRRRRIRKRKRRPQYVLSPFDTEEVAYPALPRRRLRPVRLEENREPWREMEEESVQRPYSRRRVMPKFSLEDQEQNDDPHVIQPPAAVQEKIRDPFTALKEEEDKTKSPPKAAQEETTTIAAVVSETTVVPKLKAVLKQATGSSLSLSELLQQKNLSLAELLKGNPQALSALAEKPESTNETTTLPSTTEAHRRTYSSARKPINNQRWIVNPLTEKDTSDAQKRRQALLQGSNQDKHVKGEVTKADAVTEPITTERRVFVTLEVEANQTTTETPSSSTTEGNIETTTKQVKAAETITFGNKEIITNRMSLKPKLKIPLPATVAKQNEGKPRNPSSQPLIVVPFRSPVITHDSPEVKDEEGPMKITIDIENEIRKSPDINMVHESNGERNVLEFSTKVPLHEKLKSVSAKEELMEILKDPISRERLSRILELRNMTLDELVEQRERGSSQLHLADIFHSQKREPEATDEPHIGRINSVEQKRIDPPNEPAVNIIKQKQEPDEPYAVTTFPAYKIEMEKASKEDGLQSFFPFWGNIYTPFYTNVHEDSDKESTAGNSDTYSEFNNVQRIEEIENKIAESVNEKLNVDFAQNNYSDDNDYGSVSSGVKSAILASAVIVGASIVVFLTIFVVFRWSQKQKRLNYSNSFSESRIKSPILEVQQKRSLRTIMTETLGRKKPNYQPHLQSMSDISWDSGDKKLYQ